MKKEEPKFISGQPFLEKADEVIVIHRPKQETFINEETFELILQATMVPAKYLGKK